MVLLVSGWGFPGGANDKGSTCQCRRRGFDPWVAKIPWSMKWQPMPVFLPRKFHGQRSLHSGYSLYIGLQRVRHDWVTEHTALSFKMSNKTETGFQVRQLMTWDVWLQITGFTSKCFPFYWVEYGRLKKNPECVGKMMDFVDRPECGSQLCHSVAGGLWACHGNSLSIRFLRFHEARQWKYSSCKVALRFDGRWPCKVPEALIKC